MKRNLALLLASALVLSLFPGCASARQTANCGGFPDLPPDQPWNQLVSQAFLPAASHRVEGALSSFGLELLRKTRASNAEKAMEREADHSSFSTLVSPLPAAMALSMAANGAEGDTLAQFQEVLGGGADLDEINAAWAQLAGDYCALGGSTEFTVANSLWENGTGGVSRDFAAKCQGGYGAELYRANLSALRIVDDVNGWVGEKTNGLISNIIDQPFDENTALLLINALYLKNTWAMEFEPLHTQEGEFHHAGDFTTTVKFLRHFDTSLSYIQGENAQGVVLPYDDGRLGFVAIMPDLYPDSPDLGEWLNRLEGNGLTKLIDRREDAPFLNFAMPKFEAEWKGNLEEILPLLGLKDAFIPGTANSSAMGDNPEGYYITQVVHAAKIAVNEKGTEAAAATIVDMAPGSARPPEDGITLILDRPFLYGVIDLQSGVPLFLGTYE